MMSAARGTNSVSTGFRDSIANCLLIMFNMLFCHQIHYIFMINTLLLRNFVVLIYALFRQIFYALK